MFIWKWTNNFVSHFITAVHLIQFMLNKAQKIMWNEKLKFLVFFKASCIDYQVLKSSFRCHTSVLWIQAYEPISPAVNTLYPLLQNENSTEDKHILLKHLYTAKDNLRGKWTIKILNLIILSFRLLSITKRLFTNVKWP